MMDWQPIETAPRDGTVILVHDGFGPMAARFCPKISFEEWKQTIGLETDEIKDFRAWEEEEAEYAVYDDWEYISLNPDEVIESACAKFWCPIPELVR